MSEQIPEKTPESVSKPVSTPDPGTGTETASEAVSGPSGADPEVFPAEYVRELREENAKSRTKAKRADDLAARLVSSMAAGTGRLADPSDLPYADDLLDEDGYPDEAKVLAAVDELLTRKPHLASTRVAGDVGQGARGEAEPMVSLADLLRTGAG
jgi:hypothetical protein